MTFNNLTLGSMVWRRNRVVAVSARWIVLIAALGVLRADTAFAQRSLTSVLLPTDTTGTRKASRPKVSVPKVTKAKRPEPVLLGTPMPSPADPATAQTQASEPQATASESQAEVKDGWWTPRGPDGRPTETKASEPQPTETKRAEPDVAGPRLLGTPTNVSEFKPGEPKLLGTATAEAAATTDAMNAFAHQQLANDRVLAARVEKRFELKQLFREKGIAYPAAEIFMRVFKREHVLEMWARPDGQDQFVLLKTYDICALSDKPGPKRLRGDLQTPEGFYYIDNFNPQSGYHLSLRVNYPNESDRILGSDRGTLGGDIFIHGGCKTAGCMAVTNENIKEIYWLAVEARDHGQLRIPVHIFPARLTDEGLTNLARFFGKQPDLVRFWSNIKPGFDYFEQNHKLPEYSVNVRGRYMFGHDADKSGLLGKAVATEAAGQN